jgi:ATP/maltotriose-dependent transcriptional regulator MalT
MAEPSTTTPVEAPTPERDRLLATKLHVPRPRPGFLARPRLLERLTEGTAHELTLVCAPAGFGKTSLLGEWARLGGRPVAWLSLDGGDSDPARFWRYVAAALDEARPGVGQRVDALFQHAQPPLEAVLAVLVNELVEGSEASVLVLDDYHLVEAPAVHDSLAVLLDRLPPQLRLVLASRVDPPLPLARLRAGGQLTELREADLRFTREEAAALLRTAVGTELPEAAVAALGDRTEGWAAGLQLAALSLPGHADVGAPSWRGSPAATGTCWTRWHIGCARPGPCGAWSGTDQGAWQPLGRRTGEADRPREPPIRTGGRCPRPPMSRSRPS